MKIFSIISFALLPILATAQSTAEAIRGLLPDCPSQTVIINQYLGNESAAATVVGYLNQLNDAISQSRDAVNLRMSNNNFDPYTIDVADAELQQLTGRSINELQTMSNSELEALAHGVAESMVSNSTGMSIAQLQNLASRMEGMSEEEQMAYLQSSGMLNQLRNSAQNQARNARQTTNAVRPKVDFEKTIQGHDTWIKWLNGLTALENEINEKWITLGYADRTAVWEQKRNELPPGVTVDYVRDGAAAEDRAFKAKFEYEQNVINPNVWAIKEEFLRNVCLPEWHPYIYRGMNLLKQNINLPVVNYDAMNDMEKELHEIAMAENAIEYLKLAIRLADIPTGATRTITNNE